MTTFLSNDPIPIEFWTSKRNCNLYPVHAKQFHEKQEKGSNEGMPNNFARSKKKVAMNQCPTGKGFSLSDFSDMSLINLKLMTEAKCCGKCCP